MCLFECILVCVCACMCVRVCEGKCVYKFVHVHIVYGHMLTYLISSYLSRSLADLCGTTVDFTTSFLHSSQFSAFHSMMFHSRPVHSLMSSSHCFLCLPLSLPP